MLANPSPGIVELELMHKNYNTFPKTVRWIPEENQLGLWFKY